MARGGRGNSDKEERTGYNSVITSASIYALVADLTSAITMAVAMVFARVAAAPGASMTVRKVSTAINPYDTELMDLDSKDANIIGKWSP